MGRGKESLFCKSESSRAEFLLPKCALLADVRLALAGIDEQDARVKFAW
ncbi:hypothetical protein AAFG07_31700 [Bradyrhizobium sp. B097]